MLPMNLQQLATMPQEEKDSLLLSLLAAQAKQKTTTKIGGYSLKVSEKGAISIYGVNSRFPLTIYKDHMLRILDQADRIRDFITENNALLSTKNS